MRRPAPTRLHLFLDPTAQPRTRDLVARESACCSFFAFTVTVTDAVRSVDVEVPAARVGVLDAVGAARERSVPGGLTEPATREGSRVQPYDRR